MTCRVRWMTAVRDAQIQGVKHVGAPRRILGELRFHVHSLLLIIGWNHHRIHMARRARACHCGTATAMLTGAGAARRAVGVPRGMVGGLAGIRARGPRHRVLICPIVLGAHGCLLLQRLR